MPEPKVKLDAAAFLDSPQAAALTDVPLAARRKLVEGFLACAYDELGKAPRHLDADDLHTVVGHLLPARLRRKDPAAVYAGAVLGAFLDFLEGQSVLSQAFELRRALERTLPELEEAVRTGRAVHHAPREQAAPFVHRADKTGRNDPCPCGSGRKFKKCCGKELA